MSQANVQDAFRGNGEHHSDLGGISPSMGIATQPDVYAQPNVPDWTGGQGMLLTAFDEFAVAKAVDERQPAFESQFEERLVRMERRQEGPFARRPDEGAVSPYTAARLTGPIQFIRKLVELWSLDDGAKTAVLGFEQGDQRSVEALLAGRSSIRGRDLKDRITALVRIRTLLSNLFRDPDAERTWMRTPREEFEGNSPLDLLRDGSMERLLELRQYVEHISRL